MGPVPARHPAAAHAEHLLHRACWRSSTASRSSTRSSSSRGRGPTDATITLVYFIYENGFKFFKMGYASAASWVLFLIVAGFTAIYFRLQSRWVHYQ